MRIELQYDCESVAFSYDTPDGVNLLAERRRVARVRAEVPYEKGYFSTVENRAFADALETQSAVKLQRCGIGGRGVYFTTQSADSTSPGVVDESRIQFSSNALALPVPGSGYLIDVDKWLVKASGEIPELFAVVRIAVRERESIANDGLVIGFSNQVQTSQDPQASQISWRKRSDSGSAGLIDFQHVSMVCVGDPANRDHWFVSARSRSGLRWVLIFRVGPPDRAIAACTKISARPRRLRTSLLL